MNIYVGNLAYSVTEAEMKALFEPFGEIASANLILDKFTGQSKGFGFVEMPQNEQAQAAIAKLNGTDLKGRKITVNEARPKSDRPRRERW